MKIWHISDTHTYHGLLNIPENIDLVIHSGDCSNPRDPYLSEREIRDFIAWYAAVPIAKKIFVAGNHDTAIERRLVTPADFAAVGIIYLENTSTIIDGVRIWGSPITPTFGTGWAFNKSRETISRVWDSIPDDTNIVVTHGPPKTIMDLSYDSSRVLEFCGCGALYKRIIKLKPKAVLFGHIHNHPNIVNAGFRTIPELSTQFSNGSVVTDGKFGFLSSNGNILEI